MPRVDIRTRELSALGLHTRLLEAGPAHAVKAVLFIHGGPGSAEDWTDLMGQVGAFGRAVAFDLPGFGHAEKPAQWGYHGAGWATFIAAVLNRLRVERVHLVLNDLGGDGGLAWAAANPQACASVVLINAGVLIDYRWHAVAKLHRTPLAGQLAALTGGVGLRSIMRLYEPRLPASVVDRWRRDYDLGSRRAVLRFYHATPAAAGERLRADLRALDLPALVLWGAEDRFVPVEQAERQRESFPSAEVFVLEQSGHYPQLSAPARVADKAIPFLRHQLSRGVHESERRDLKRAGGVR
jgi:pimeloyl-ACP methyl ester carboxylesterase